MNRRTWTAALAVALLAGWASRAPAQQQAQPGSLPKGVVATVHGDPITRAELDAVLKAAGPSALAIPEAQRKHRQMEALALLIDNVLMRQYLANDKETAPVSPEEVKRRLTEMETALLAKGKSLAEFCHDTHQTQAQLEASIRDDLRWSAYLAKNLSDARVEKYHQDNKDFFDKVLIQASHIFLRVPANASEAEKQKARARLQGIRDKLQNDPKCNFAEMARQYSQDGLALKGGDLGWFPRKWAFDEKFSRAAFETQVGQISPIVETEDGLHLIKVTDRKPGEPSDFNKIKEAVREICAEDRRQEILQRLRKEARNAIVFELP